MSGIDPRLIHIRDYLKTDEGFVYSTWLKALYSGSLETLKGREDFFHLYHAVLETIIESPTVSIRVVCLNADPDVILSYSVTEPCPDSDESLLHWIYTRRTWRRMGLAASLLKPHKIVAVTHLTKLGQEIKPKEWAYLPIVEHEQSPEIQS